jgi:photosystem II stability/assembly factor-like uncharacterized protein
VRHSERSALAGGAGACGRRLGRGLVAVALLGACFAGQGFLGLAAAGAEAPAYEVQFASSAYAFEGIACGSSAGCVAVGFRTGAPTGGGPGAAVATTSAGGSWSEASMPMSPSPDPNLSGGVSCASATLCVAVGGGIGGNSGAPGVEVSTDGGASFTDAALPSGISFLSGVSCPSTTTCFAVGATTSGSAAVLRSTDQGSTWTLLAVPPGIEGLEAVSCADPANCETAGSSPATPGGGRITVVLVTTAGGSTWTVDSVPGAPPPEGLACPTSSTCFLVGSQANGGGAAYETRDGGATWQASSLPGSVLGLSAVACASTSVCALAGMGAGGSGLVLETTDGGASWSSLPLPAGVGQLSGIACPTTAGCFAVGGGTIVADAPQPPATSIPLQRLAGQNRDLTSVAVSEAAFPESGSAGAVVLASDAAFPDALAGSPLAVAVHGPLLLTTPQSLDPAVADEIRRVLLPGRTVYLLGGSAALSGAVQSAVEALGYATTRLAGQTRFGTAVAIAGALGDPSTVLEATGLDFPDGLSAGAAAAKLGAAVLLTDGSEQAPETAAYLAAHPGRRFAIGGPACRADPGATCLAGSTRFGTAVRVAEQFFPQASVLGFASAMTYPDALAGGADMGRLGGPVVLVPATGDLPGDVYDYLLGASGAKAGRLYGGSAAVDDQVAAEIG